jgi:hypothetical protein
VHDADPTQILQWAIHLRGLEYQFSVLSDMVVEPRWRPEWADPSILTADIFGRAYGAFRNIPQGKAPPAWGPLIERGKAWVDKEKVTLFLMYPSVLEGAVPRAAVPIDKMDPPLADVFRGFIADPTIDVVLATGGTGVTGRVIQLNLLTNGSPDELVAVSQQIMDAVKDVPGLVDLGRSFQPGKPELHIDVDRDKAARLGLSTAAVGATVRTLVNGDTASRYREPGREADILVRLRPEDRARLQDILDLSLTTVTGQVVPLRNVATLSDASGPSALERLNRQAKVTIGANILGRAQQTVADEIQARVNVLKLPHDAATIARIRSSRSEKDRERLTTACPYPNRRSSTATCAHRRRGWIRIPGPGGLCRGEETPNALRQACRLRRRPDGTSGSLGRSRARPTRKRRIAPTSPSCRRTAGR